MGSFGNFVGGLLAGAAVGAAVVMFTSPKSGERTRSDLRDLWQNAIDTGKETAKRREEELWADFNIRTKGASDNAARL